MKLQKFGFSESSYERPNRKWSCGRSCDGCPCKQGPVEKPILNIFTASCSQTEDKCKPMRTVRGQRYILNFGVVLFTLAIVVFILSSQDSNKAFISPGPLSSHHSTIEGQNCFTCHDLQGHSTWLGASLSDHSSLSDSKKCLNCHKFNTVQKPQEELDLAALNPHSIQVASVFAGKEAKFQKEQACTTCHVEHQGYDNDMKFMSDKRCQSCHESSFQGLGEGHPEFTLFPYKKENYVNFSHQTHVKYFDENNRQDLLGNENCTKCHTQNPDEGNIIKMTTYENVCSSCHNHTVPIENIPVNILSLVDPVSSKSKNSVFSADTFTEESVKDLKDSGVLRYLNDKQSLLDVVEGRTSSQISSLTLTEEEKVKKLAATLAGGWQDLLYIKAAQKSGDSFFKALQWAIVDIAYKADSTLTKNSLSNNKEAVIKLFVGNKEITRLLKMAMKTYGLKCGNAVEFAESIKHARIEKFLTELSALLPDDIKKFVPYNLSADDKTSPFVKYLEAKGKLSAKMIKELNGTIKNNPSSIYKYLKEMDVPTGTSVYYKKFYDSIEDVVGKNKDLVQKAKDSFNDIVPFFVENIYQDKGVLKDLAKVVDRKVSKSFKSSTKPAEAIALLKEYEPLILLNLAFIIDEKSAPAGASEPQLPKIPEIPEFSPVEVATWKASADDEGNNYLVYQTAPFHASPLMVKAYSKQVFDRIDDPAKSQGKCMQCHSRINSDNIDAWKTPTTKKSLTKFSHVPHGSDCSSCHSYKQANEPSLAAYPKYHKDFRPLQKMDCAKCHNEDGAGDSCLKCHNYHSTDYSAQKVKALSLIEFFKGNQK